MVHFVLQCLGAPLRYLNKTALKEAFASYLKLPVENVCIDKILVITTTYIMWFMDSLLYNTTGHW